MPSLTNSLSHEHEYWVFLCAFLCFCWGLWTSRLSWFVSMRIKEERKLRDCVHSKGSALVDRYMILGGRGVGHCDGVYMMISVLAISLFLNLKKIMISKSQIVYKNISILDYKIPWYKFFWQNPFRYKRWQKRKQ